MRFTLALALITMLIFLGTAAHAQAPIWYWCDTWRAYYPQVVSCPVPWRAVIGSTPSEPLSTAQPSASEEPTQLLPQVSRQRFPALGDGLDDWCAQVKLPSSIAICSDPGLRALTIERQQAFNLARWGLDPQRDKALLADQNNWVNSYPLKCGLAQDTAPALPLAPGVKDCMAQAGRARIAYLRAYGPAPSTPDKALPQLAQAQTQPAAAQSGPARLGPSFDCDKTKQPLALLVCTSPALSKLDLQFVQAYQALRQQVGAAGQEQLRQEAANFQQSVLGTCGVPKTGPVSGSADCVAAQYDSQRSLWLSRLRGPANEEAARPIEQHIALQAQLQKLGFLPPTEAIDGVYGETTRAAILAWQRANGRMETGLIGDADATVLADPALAEHKAGAPPQPQSTPALRHEATPTDYASTPAKSDTKVVPQRPANEGPPAADTTPDNSDTISMFYIIIPLTILVIGVTFTILKTRAQEKHRQFVNNRVLKETHDIVVQHMRALVRKRFQTLRHDDYGNLLREPWEKEITYFMENVLRPRIIQLGYEEYAFYTTMQLALRLTIEELVQQHAASSGSITFGPNLSPTDFEHYCAEQLRSAGWSADTTKASGDQGTDIIAQKGDLRLVVQCKLYNHPVGNKAVQEIAAARTHEGADWAAVVSNTRYTPSAHQLAATNGVLLLHHTDLRNIDDLLPI